MVESNRYYGKESINFQNTITLTYLSIVIIVQKTPTLNSPSSYDTIGGVMSRTINETDTFIIYTFNLNHGSTIQPRPLSVTAYFNLSSQTRDASNDTYSIQTDPSQVINGHF